MSSYLTLDRFKLLAAMPSSFVDEVETRAPGYVLAQGGLASARIDAKLRKRYEFPVTDTAKIPVIVEAWITAMITPLVFMKRGVSGTDEQWQEYLKAAEAAVKELGEAADAEKGLFDLPLRNDDSTGTGVVHGAPMVYSEQSPYVWADKQREIGRDEDTQGEGSSS